MLDSHFSIIEAQLLMHFKDTIYDVAII